MKTQIIQANENQIWSEQDSFTLKRYEIFSKYLDPSHIKILDFGCNTGRGGTVLKKNNPQLILVGADIIVERLKKIQGNIYIKTINLAEVRLLDSIKSIDVIVSGEVVEHIPLKELVNYFSDFYDILSENGLLLLTTPNPSSILVKLGRDGVYNDPSHINIMKSTFLVTLLKKIGFSNITVKGSGKATKYFGEGFPISNIYGSYLVIARK